MKIEQLNKENRELKKVLRELKNKISQKEAEEKAKLEIELVEKINSEISLCWVDFIQLIIMGWKWEKLFFDFIAGNNIETGIMVVLTNLTMIATAIIKYEEEQKVTKVVLKVLVVSAIIYLYASNIPAMGYKIATLIFQLFVVAFKFLLLTDRRKKIKDLKAERK